MSRRPFGPSKGPGVAGGFAVKFLTLNFSHRDLESIAQVRIARSLPTVSIATPPPAKERKKKRAVNVDSLVARMQIGNSELPRGMEVRREAVALWHCAVPYALPGPSPRPGTAFA